MSIEVKDFDLTETKTVRKVEFRVIQLELNKSCRVACQLYDTENRLIKSEIYDIQGSEYQGWGADDLYLENLLLNKLGLTKK